MHSRSGFYMGIKEAGLSKPRRMDEKDQYSMLMTHSWVSAEVLASLAMKR